MLLIEGQRKKIILVDDMIVNLTAGREALSKIYDVFTVPSGEKLMALLQKIMPDMILLDIEMPQMSGIEVIKILKSDLKTEHIPVIFLTGKNDVGSELEGLSLGAVDYISKPFSPSLLLKRIEVHLLVENQKRELQNYNDNLEKMVKEKTKTIFSLQESIIEIMAELVECRDDATGGHIDRTKKYLAVLIKALTEKNIYTDEVRLWDINLIIMSAQLHDVGKIAISDAILCKPGRLTNEEFNEMKKHTTFGGEVIEKIQKRNPNQEFLEYAKILALYHHEKWDGSGYPHGLLGEDIPLAARIMAIVDVYDALVSERPYKKPFSHKDAVKIIADGKGTQFDPILIDLFISIESQLDSIRMTKGEGY